MAQAASLKQLKVLTGVVSRYARARGRDGRLAWRRARPARRPTPVRRSPVIYSRLSPCARLSRLCRTVKDLGASAKEIAAQEKRIESTKTDADKDEHDVKKQMEVLKEYQDGVLDEV